MKNYDVIVIGGGFAGIGAAIGAAKQNKKVLLVEQSGSLGGAAVNNLVLPFMSTHTSIEVGDGKFEKFELVRGVFAEIVSEIKKSNCGDDYYFNTEYLKVVLDRIIIKSGVEVLYHTTLTDVIKNGRNIEAVKLHTVAGALEVKAKVFIDATGDANLSYLAGCGFNLGRESDNLCQPMTLCFRVGGVGIKEVYANLDKMQERFKQLKDEGKIRNPRENILLFRTFDKNVVHFNTTRVVKLNPTDPFDLTKAEMEAREQMIELVDFLKAEFECFKDAEIVNSATSIGVRESRMIEGEYKLTGDNLVKTIKFEDAIAAGNYDIDIHNPEGGGTSHYYFPNGEYYTIPYRSLVAKDFDNLLVAGRCISCDHEAQASIRIMPICAATGEATGVAASVCIDKNCSAKNNDIAEIQSILKNNGAFIGI